jgi:short-subunit dehydrogenase
MVLKGKVVFITGASSGIGRELARVLHSKGAKLALAARRLERLEELKKELGGAPLALKLDVTDRSAVAAAIDKAVQHFGRLDILVNDAGVAYFGSLAAMPQAEMERIIRTNIFGLLNGIQAAVPHLKKTKGMVVNISSGLSKRALPFLSFYSGSKSMVDALSDGLRMELRGSGVKVLNYCPPETKTEFGDVTAHEPGLSLGASERKLASVKDVVGRIAKAMEKGTREVVDGAGFLKVMNFWAPTVLDNIFYKAMVKGAVKE